MNEMPPKRPVETPAVWFRFADENLAVARVEPLGGDVIAALLEHASGREREP